MSPERLEVLILHLRDVAAELAEYTRNLSADEVSQDLMRERGVVMSVMIVGELAGRIVDGHPEILAEIPDIPWARIRSLRNRIAHGYFELDFDVVWDVAVNAVPAFASRLTALLPPPHTGT